MNDNGMVSAPFSCEPYGYGYGYGYEYSIQCADALEYRYCTTYPED